PGSAHVPHFLDELEPRRGDVERIAPDHDLRELAADELRGGLRGVAVTEALLAAGAQLDEEDGRARPLDRPVGLRMVRRDDEALHGDGADAGVAVGLPRTHGRSAAARLPPQA